MVITFVWKMIFFLGCHENYSRQKKIPSLKQSSISISSPITSPIDLMGIVVQIYLMQQNPTKKLLLKNLTFQNSILGHDEGM